MGWKIDVVWRRETQTKRYPRQRNGIVRIRSPKRICQHICIRSSGFTCSKYHDLFHFQSDYNNSLFFIGGWIFNVIHSQGKMQLAPELLAFRSSMWLNSISNLPYQTDVRNQAQLHSSKYNDHGLHYWNRSLCLVHSWVNFVLCWF